MISRQTAAQVIGQLARPGDISVDLFLERTRSTTCELIDGEPHFRDRVDEGMGLHRVGRHSVVHVHVPGIGEPGLEDLRRRAQGEGGVPLACAETIRYLEAAPDAKGLLDVANRCAQRAALRSRDAKLQISAKHTIRTIEIFDGLGRASVDRQEFASVSLSAVAAKDRRVRQARRFHGALTPGALLTEGLDRLVDEALHAATERLEAIDAPTGELAVVLGPGGPAGLIHEICGHGLEGDIASHPKSAYSGRIGDRLASPAFTLVDDPTAPRWGPAYRFDDEGSVARPTVLVECGVLRTYLHDARSARAAGTTSNGHGRRLSYAHSPMPRMSTTYVAAGPDPAPEIIADTKKGLYITAISGGDTDFDSGRFAIRVSEGRMIENGRLAAPVRGAVISGTGPEVLSRIDRVGDDLRFQVYGYTCNKLDQFPLTVSVGQPTLRVSSMLVWGG